MPRMFRGDYAGARHHVFNRAIARRTMFESRRDMRHFLGQVAKSVHRGEIRLFAFCLMSTHFHLFVGSPMGVLDTAMQRIQTTYSRYFNRSRRRDGPLVRGRFGSRLVDSEEYAEALVRYIDENPVHARLVKSPSAYEYGSASHRVAGRETRWLSDPFGATRSTPGCRPSLNETEYRALAEVIERRLKSRGKSDLLFGPHGTTPASVREWMVRKAKLSDGTEPGLPVGDARNCIRIIRSRQSEIEKLSVRPGPDAASFVQHMTAGLLRELCGLRHAEVAAMIGKSPSAASDSALKHRQLLCQRTDYASMASELAMDLLRQGPMRRIGLAEIT